VGIEASLSHDHLMSLFFAPAVGAASPSSIDMAAVDAAGVSLPLSSSRVPAEAAFPSANR